jgi:hypothetical protein
MNYREKIGFAIWILIGLLSGPAVVATVAAVATNAGFVVPPGAAPRYAGPQGREADITEVYASRLQTGGSLGLVKQDHRAQEWATYARPSDRRRVFLCPERRFQGQARGSDYRCASTIGHVRAARSRAHFSER